LKILDTLLLTLRETPLRGRCSVLFPLGIHDGNLPRFIEDKERAGELDPEIKRLSRDALSQITPKSKRMMMPAPRGTEHKQLGHVPLQMRSASNPGNFGHDWVKMRFIDDGKVDPDTERGRLGKGGDPCKNGPKDCPECGSYYVLSSPLIAPVTWTCRAGLAH
jgi:hypothetical protein